MTEHADLNERLGQAIADHLHALFDLTDGRPAERPEVRRAMIGLSLDVARLVAAEVAAQVIEQGVHLDLDLRVTELDD